MGEVHVMIGIRNPSTGAIAESISALVDTGATLSVIPGSLLTSLGIDRTEAVTGVLADGREVVRDVGLAVVIVNARSTGCLVVFGEDHDTPVVGLTVLDQLGLAVDPVGGRLVRRHVLM